MIYDHISNISRYLHLVPGIAEALQFLQQAPANIPVGRHQLSGDNYVNIDTYTTKSVNPVGYEAHEQYIDIQYLVQGQEEVWVRNLRELQCTMPYDPLRDVAFFRATDSFQTKLKLGKGYFVILFPQDAHEPQHCLLAPAPVKKLVAKVAIQQQPLPFF